jgi:hypothetical protein
MGLSRALRLGGADRLIERPRQKMLTPNPQTPINLCLSYACPLLPGSGLAVGPPFAGPRGGTILPRG